MKKLVGLAALILLLALVLACRKDVFVEPPPSLTGDYIGSYTWDPDDAPAVTQPITWRFSSNGYSMYYDEESDTRPPDQKAQNFCNTLGNYELVNGVQLSPTDWNVNSDLCQDSLGPFGTFQLDQSTDTVKMTQYNSERGETKTIKLLLK